MLKVNKRISVREKYLFMQNVASPTPLAWVDNLCIRYIIQKKRGSLIPVARPTTLGSSIAHPVGTMQRRSPRMEICKYSHIPKWTSTVALLLTGLGIC